MAAVALTIVTLDEDGLSVVNVGVTLTNVDGVGDGSSDGNSFVNTDKTLLIFHADGHDATVTFTVEPRDSTLQTPGLGELDVDDLTVTLVASNITPQTGYLRVPKGYNPATGKVIVKATSGGDFVAGEIKIAAVVLG